MGGKRHWENSASSAARVPASCAVFEESVDYEGDLRVFPSILDNCLLLSDWGCGGCSIYCVVIFLTSCDLMLEIFYCL